MQPQSGLAELLRMFRSEHTPRYVEVRGTRWEYLSGGQGSRTLILLPGGGGEAENFFPLMAALENEFRVIAIGCPDAIARTQDAIDGIAAVMDEESVGQVCLLGHSLGGMFAECFMMQHPERTGSMILANIAHYGKLRRALIGGLIPAMSHTPRWLLGRRARATFSRLLKGHPEKEFWLSHLCDEVARAGADAWSNRCKCMRDVMSRSPASRADLHGWDGPVLILESDNETGFTKSERLALRRLYPNAEVHVFQAAGHLSPITRPREFETVVRQFLNR